MVDDCRQSHADSSGTAVRTFTPKRQYIISIICILTCNEMDMAQVCSRTYSVQDYTLEGHVISTNSKQDIWGCFQECKRKTECQSINYEVNTYICGINNRTKRGRPNRFVRRVGSVYMENPFRGVFPYLPGLSCKDIKDSHTDIISGKYWVDPSNTRDPFPVFCDMETDGGGWTLIAQTLVRNSTSFPAIIREKDTKMIQNYSSGLVRVDTTAILHLKQLINFTQIRYFCRKKATGRTFHIMTKSDPHGERVVQYLTENPSVQPSACGSFVAFPDDNSYLAPNCSKWGNDGRDIECNRWGYYQNKGFFRIYNDPIIWEGKHYINLKPSVLACDDSTGNPYPLSQGDKWQLFVR